MTLAVSTFYKFVAIEDPAALKAEVAASGCRLGIRGTVIIAGEGINATVAGTNESVQSFLRLLRSDKRFRDLESKESWAATQPFRRFKVKVKPEIVTFGRPEINPAANAGTYVEAGDWNALIQQPDVIVVDTRNAYETRIGTFPGAIDPNTQNFSEFAAFVDQAFDPGQHRKVAMFCTGGIRCEKATAYLRSKGFEDVYHLHGGILKYLQVVPSDESLWSGDCFIFDARIALDHASQPRDYRLCHVCGFPVPGANRGGDQDCLCNGLKNS
jgi:UPF0176 protein